MTILGQKIVAGARLPTAGSKRHPFHHGAAESEEPEKVEALANLREAVERSRGNSRLPDGATDPQSTRGTADSH
jgi:hypothetical protein